MIIFVSLKNDYTCKPYFMTNSVYFIIFGNKMFKTTWFALSWG